MAFKLGKSAHEEAEQLLRKGVNMVLANKPENLGSENGQYTIIDSFGYEQADGSKHEIASMIFDRIIAKHL